MDTSTHRHSGPGRGPASSAAIPAALSTGSISGWQSRASPRCGCRAIDPCAAPCRVLTLAVPAPMSVHAGMESVAHAAHGVDQPVASCPRERLAQLADVHVHRALLDAHLLAPALVEQTGAAVDPPGPGHEEMQHAEIDISKLDFAPVAGHPAHGAVDPQALRLGDFIGTLGRAAAH